MERPVWELDANPLDAVAATTGGRMSARFLAMSIDACTRSAAPRRTRRQDGSWLVIAAVIVLAALGFVR